MWLAGGHEPPTEGSPWRATRRPWTGRWGTASAAWRVPCAPGTCGCARGRRGAVSAGSGGMPRAEAEGAERVGGWGPCVPGGRKAQQLRGVGAQPRAASRPVGAATWPHQKRPCEMRLTSRAGGALRPAATAWRHASMSNLPSTGPADQRLQASTASFAAAATVAPARITGSKHLVCLPGPSRAPACTRTFHSLLAS